MHLKFVLVILAINPTPAQKLTHDGSNHGVQLPPSRPRHTCLSVLQDVLRVDADNRGAQPRHPLHTCLSMLQDVLRVGADNRGVQLPHLTPSHVSVHVPGRPTCRC